MAKIKDYAKEPPFCVPYHPVIFKDIEASLSFFLSFFLFFALFGCSFHFRTSSPTSGRTGAIVVVDQVPIHAYHAYDALMTYARALTEALKDGHDPRNGTAIMERIRNRPYHSILGFEVNHPLKDPPWKA